MMQLPEKSTGYSLKRESMHTSMERNTQTGHASGRINVRAWPRTIRAGLFAIAAITLAACQSSTIGEGLPQPQPNAGDTGQAPEVMTSEANGEILGQGNVRVALLIPKSAPGNAAAAATQIRNGAALAMQDFGNNTIQLVIKDTKGTAAGAQDAAAESIREGASAILGPLFSANVSSASGITQPAGKTIIAFSTDSSVARRGVYLLSYTPQADTQRMITYALSQGKRSIHAFLPNNAEGNLREAVLKQVAGGQGANVFITKYELSGPGIEAAARSAVTSLQNADAIYIPDGGQIPEVMLTSISRAGGSLEGKQVMGGGQWESVKFGNSVLEGAWYSSRDITNFNAFASRYQGAYGSQPGVLAALGYDAVTLASTLVSNKGEQAAFSSTTLEDRRGFAGINGIFRLTANGTAERGLAIYQVSGGQGSVLSQAPTSFGPNS